MQLKETGYLKRFKQFLLKKKNAFIFPDAFFLKTFLHIMIVFFPWINGFFSQCKSFSLLCEWELLLFHTSRCILHQDKWEACFFLSKAQTFSQIFLLPLLFLKFLFQRAMVRSKFECCRSNWKEVRCLWGPNIEVPEYRRNLGIEKGIFFRWWE